jgi:hypothetical protein
MARALANNFPASVAVIARLGSLPTLSVFGRYFGSESLTVLLTCQVVVIVRLGGVGAIAIVPTQFIDEGQIRLRVILHLRIQSSEVVHGGTHLDFLLFMSTHFTKSMLRPLGSHLHLRGKCFRLRVLTIPVVMLLLMIFHYFLELILNAALLHSLRLLEFETSLGCETLTGGFDRDLEAVEFRTENLALLVTLQIQNDLLSRSRSAKLTQVHLLRLWVLSLCLSDTATKPKPPLASQSPGWRSSCLAIWL